MAQKNTGWKEIDTPPSPFWVPQEKGEEIEGSFQGFRDGEYGKNGVIKTDRDTYRYLPSNVLLNSKLEQIPEGTWIKVVYQGFTKLPSGRRAKDFRVYVKEGEQ